MKIQLTKGLFAEIDDGDFNSVSKHKWYAMKSKHTFYAATNAPMINGVRGKTILMHKLICGESSLVDHKDGNGLNNLRENLRPATKSLNAVNSKRRDGASSQHRGVVWDSKRNRWAAYARIGGKSKNLGRFKTEIEAAAAYRAVAIPAYGEFLRN